MHVSKMDSLLAALAMSAGPQFRVFNETVDKIDELQEQLVTLQTQMNNIQAKADGEKRALTSDESKLIEELFAEFDDIESEIERRHRLTDVNARAAAPRGRHTEPDPVSNSAAADGGRRGGGRTMVPAAARDPNDVGKWGFHNVGEFASKVRAAHPSSGGRSIDPRLIANAPTSYGSEGVGEDGGFAVPPDFRRDIMVKVMGEDSLLARTDQLTSSSNSITIPKDETTPWQTSGGIQAAWEGEGGQFTQSKPNLEQATIRLNKLTALVPVTEELLADAPALSTYLRRKTPEKFDFKINDAILNGTGAGQPLGVLQSGALITVNAESGQAADTVRFENIVNMYSRLYSGSRSTAVWLINQDVEPQLLTMQFPGTGTAVPAYLPPGGLSAQPYGTLLGRPVIATEAAQTLGDAGDITLVDLRQYMTAMKTGGIRQDVSMHLWFDYDVTAFRFVMRVAGQPWWTSAISPKNGSNTRSFAVNLAARA